MTSPTAQPLPPGTVSPWTPYRDPANRIELLPPVDFNLEQDTFASEPIADLDPVTADGNKKKASFGRAAPVSMGGFWAPNTPVVGQPTNLQMNAQFARLAIPLGIPEEGKPLWLAIAKFGRLELATDAILPDSGQRVPGQFWLVETGLKAFSVVILGGLDSFGGAIIAGPIIGLCESLGGGYLTPYIWAGVKDIIPFIIIIIVVVIKPYGLFGEERIERI